MAQPHPAANELPIRLDVVDRAGESYQGPRTEYDPALWRSQVAALRTALRVGGDPRCPISGTPIDASRARSKEHVVHQATGIRWVNLPRGTVDDEANNALSGDEGHFYRSGAMGVLLPMYLNKTKEVTFQAGGGRTVTIANHHERGVEFHLRDGDAVFSELPDEGGPGTLRLRLIVPQPVPVRASRALCKSAYLALCVHAPSVALRDEFAPLRGWLAEGGESGHRPYAEKLLRAPLPGAEFRFLLHGSLGGGGEILGIDRATAFVRIHMLGYTVSLLGAAPPFERFGHEPFEVFSKPNRSTAERLMTFDFGFDAVRRVPGTGE
jgi:hypothetical protein